MFSGIKTGCAALVLALTPTLAPTLAGAATMNFDTSSDLLVANFENQGWWNAQGNHTAENDNYATIGDTYRSFFSFKLTGLAGKVITGLELQIWRYGSRGTGTISLHDVSTAASTLVAGGSGRTDIFDDLGTGNLYGSGALSMADSTGLLSFTLNDQALADATTALGGWFSIGASLTSGSFGSASGLQLNGMPQTLQRLVVTYDVAPVPLPASLPLLGAGMAGLVALRRRKKA